MAARLTNHVRERAAGRCEYCHPPQSGSNLPFEIDHIVSRKHHGRTVAGNLALACWYCNSFKGSDLSGIDPVTRNSPDCSIPAATDGHGISVTMVRY